MTCHLRISALNLNVSPRQTTEKLERDRIKLQAAFDTAAEAFTHLSATIMNANVDTSAYPQYHPSYINNLQAAMEGNVEQCFLQLEEQRLAILRLTEVDGACGFSISPNGALIVGEAMSLMNELELCPTCLDLDLKQ